MDNKFVCDVCKKEFKNENGLRGHVQWIKDAAHKNLFNKLYGDNTSNNSNKTTVEQKVGEKQQQMQQQTQQPQSTIIEPQPPIQDETQTRQQQPQILKAAQQPMTQQPTPIIQIPITSPPEPEDWMEQFLLRWPDIKQNYVLLQKMRVKETKELPQPMDFERDLIAFESGYKNKRPEAGYIRTFYEGALKEYLSTINTPLFQRGYGTSYQQPNRGYEIRPGIQVGQPQYEPYREPYRDPYHQYDPYGRQYNQPYPSDGRSNEVKELRDELKRMNEERYQRQEQRMEQMRMEMGQRSQRSPEIEKLEMKIDRQAEEYRKLQDELARRNAESYNERLNRVENIARSGPGVDQIRQIVDDSIVKQRSILTGEDLNQRIQGIINAQHGITQHDVELKKAQHEYNLKNLEIEADKEKTGQWADTIKEAAGTVSQALGTFASAKQAQPTPIQQQQAAPQASQINCPTCGKLLDIPVGVDLGECPGCRTKIQIDQMGNAYIYPGPMNEPEMSPRETQSEFKNTKTRPNEIPVKPNHSLPAEKQPGYTNLMSDDNFVGMCPKCGKPIYETGPNMNIGKVEDGKPYCKDCA